MFSRVLRTVGVMALLWMLLAVPAQAAPPNDATGTAPGVDLTARWWQVALASGDLGFWFDDAAGANCRSVDTPSGPVVMAAGTFGGPSGPRTCSVPAGATVVLPVLNSIYFLTEPPPIDTVGLARRDLHAFLDGATATATVDGVDVAVRRLHSSLFTVNGAVLGLGLVPATSDGYWVVWRPAPGTYSVETEGAQGSFSTSTTYTFEVG